jgi:hypothetical protein
MKMSKVKLSVRGTKGTIFRRRLRLAAILGILLAVTSVWAHHGLAAFDTTHTVMKDGTVTDFQFVNPHVFIFADMVDDKGKKANWRLEMGSPGMLSKYGGWNATTVRRGDRVRIQGFLAKDGSPYMSVGRIWLPDGRSLEGRP